MHEDFEFLFLLYFDIFKFRRPTLPDSNGWSLCNIRTQVAKLSLTYPWMQKSGKTTKAQGWGGRIMKLTLMKTLGLLNINPEICPNEDCY